MAVTSICLFTRDLRVTDNPALAHALSEGDQVVPLFVLDDALLAALPGSPNRISLPARGAARPAVRPCGTSGRT